VPSALVAVLPCRLGRKAKLIRRTAKPPQGCADCDNRIKHLLFGKKDHANLIETFWQLRFQLAEILDTGQAELAAKVAREQRDMCREALKDFQGLGNR